MVSFCRKWIVYGVVAAVALYAVILVIVSKNQESVLFHPKNVDSELKEKHSKLEVSYEIDGVTLKGWLVQPKKHTLVIYYGGNAEELSHMVNVMKSYPNSAALLVNYRGYGESGGSPSEYDLYSDALTLYDRVSPKYKRVILVGRSLGAGIASYVAAHRKVAGVALVTPYDSMEKVASDHYPLVPMSMILKHKFKAEEYARKVDAPGLFIIAEFDEVISSPRSHGLYEAWAGKKKTIIVDEADHNSIDLSSYAEGKEIADFIFRLSR